MPYTLWMHDKKIGQTRFELATSGRRRAGIFHPTEYGITVLPGITAMFPALLDFGELCRREGLDVNDDRPENASAALEAFGGTPEGQRVIAAAKHVAAVVVRDPHGRTLVWESLAISDLSMLAALSRKARNRTPAETVAPTGDPARFLVSLTLAVRGGQSLPGGPKHFAAQDREAASN